MRRLFHSPPLIAGLAVLIIGVTVVVATPAGEYERPRSPRASVIPVKLTAKEQSRSHWAQRAAMKAGALAIGLSRRGDGVVLFPAGEPVPDVPGIPGPGIRLVVSPFTREEYRQVTRRIDQLARRMNVAGPKPHITAGYTYAYSHDVDTGQIRLQTDAPWLDVERLRREFPHILVVSTGDVPKLLTLGGAGSS